MKLDDLFSKNELIELHELVYRAVRSEKETDLKDVMGGLRRFVDFKYSTLHYVGDAPSNPLEMKMTKKGKSLLKEIALGKFTHVFRSEDVPFDWLMMPENYPLELMDYLIDNDEIGNDPVNFANISRFEPQYWQDIFESSPLKFSAGVVEVMERTGYLTGYIHGVGVPGRIQHHSGMILAGPDMERSERTEAVMELVMPHLHHRVERLFRKISTPVLSERELEVLKWTANGKTSWEVSKILNITERTINFHVQNIVKKLDAVSRTHAVAIAVAKELVTLD